MAFVLPVPRDIAAPSSGGFAGRTLRRASVAAAHDTPPGIPELILFDERDLSVSPLRSHPKQQPFGSRASIATELSTARTAEERTRIIRSMLHIIGFTCMACLTLQLVNEEILRAFVLNGGMPLDLLNLYFREQYHRIDPRMETVRTSGMPLIWDLSSLADALRGSPDAARARALISALDRYEMRSGMMFGIPVPRTNLHTIVSFSAAQPTRDWIVDSVFGQALTLGLSVHQSASGYTRALAQQSGAFDLSEMQQRILAGLAAGLSDKEIAQRLHTTPHNVDYHLRLLRKKYNVNNRTQLAYTAGRHSLV